MMTKTAGLALAIGLATAACSSDPATTAATTDGNVSIRHLAKTDVATKKHSSYPIQGRLIPTPSDTASRYFLVRERQAASGNIVAIVRQEMGDRVAYARTEIDCGKRLFHVLGVGPDRRIAETHVDYDGPLRPITGLPLRQEMASFICGQNGTPLATA